MLASGVATCSRGFLHDSYSGLSIRPDNPLRSPSGITSFSLPNFWAEQLFSRNCYPSCRLERRENMLWTIFVILLILWLLGFSFHVAGGLIHLLLVIAVIVLIVNLLSGRSTAV
jgi:hypothetical protein